VPARDPLHALLGVDRVEPSVFEGLRQVLARVAPVHELLEEAGEQGLVHPRLLRVPLLVLSEHLAPGRLHGLEDANVQRLELICRVGGQADESNIILFAELDDLGGDVAG